MLTKKSLKSPSPKGSLTAVAASVGRRKTSSGECKMERKSLPLLTSPLFKSEKAKTFPCWEIVFSTLNINWLSWCGSSAEFPLVFPPILPHRRCPSRRPIMATTRRTRALEAEIAGPESGRRWLRSPGSLWVVPAAASQTLPYIILIKFQCCQAELVLLWSFHSEHTRLADWLPERAHHRISVSGQKELCQWKGKKTKFCFEILTLENSANSQSRREWGVIFDGFHVWVNAFSPGFLMEVFE